MDLLDIVKDSVADLCNFIDSMNTYKYTLKLLRQPKDLWNTLFIHLFYSQLDD
jgi:hypothetical protein